jgi:hypothetical protein
VLQPPHSTVQISLIKLHTIGTQPLSQLLLAVETITIRPTETTNNRYCQPINLAVKHASQGEYTASLH